MTQIEISNVSFTLFSYYWDLFFSSDSDNINELSFVYFLFVPKNINTTCGAKRHFCFQFEFAIFLPNSRFQALVFLLFFVFQKLVFQVWQRPTYRTHFFWNFLILCRKKKYPSVARVRTFWEKKKLCHFLALPEISNVSSFIVVFASETWFWNPNLSDLNNSFWRIFWFYSQKNYSQCRKQAYLKKMQFFYSKWDI